MEDEYLTLIEAINSSDVTKTYTLDANEVISQNLGTLQGTTLTINGGSNTISSDNESEGIVVNNGQTLNISNVSDWTGFDRQFGGVINNSGTVVINTSDFTDNKAQHGSVIFNDGLGAIEVTNATFENNSRITSVAESNYAYGVIYNEGTAILTDVDFIRNHMGSAGAFYNVGTATITKANFIENIARIGGTIVAIDGSVLTLRESIFDANSGDSNGAAGIRIDNGAVNIYDSVFRNHYEIEENPDDPYYDRQNGGVIYQYDPGYAYDEEGNIIGFLSEPALLHIEDTSFIDNTVARGGGAIYTNGHVRLINVLFQNNKSDIIHGDNSAGTGGAFYSYNRTNYFYDDTYCIMDGCRFIGNSAYTAGAIYHAIGRLDVLNTRFEGNESLRTGGFGGCFFTQSGTVVNLTNVDFINNESLGSGGVIGTEAGSFNINNCLFDGNVAGTRGGVIMTYIDAELVGDEPTIIINNSTIINNRGINIFDNVYTLRIINSEIEGNSGILIDTENNLVVDDITVNSHTGTLIQGTGSINITNSNIKNVAGVVINLPEDLSNEEAVFIDNLNIESNTTTTTNPYTFSGNINNSRIAIIKNSSFINNRCSNTGTGIYGGAVLCGGDTILIADNGDSIFRGNTYNNISSAICVRLNETPTTLYAGTNNSTTGKFVFNDSICIEPNAQLNINSTNTENYPTNGVIQINDSVRLGGTIPYGSRATVNLNNGIIQFGNTTVDYGEGEVQSFGNIVDAINFNVNGGTISTIDNRIGETNLGRLVLNSNVNFQLDVNLSNSTCDTLTYESFTANSNSIIIDEINIIANGEEGEINIQITNDVNLRTAIRFSDNVRFTTSRGIFGRYEITNYDSSTGVVTINYTYMEELFEIKFNGDWVGSEWTLANITYYDIDSNVTTQTSLATHYIFVDGIIELPTTAFVDCIELVSIDIPNTITSLENDCFNGCSNLKSVILPDNITEIPNFAFTQCTSLTDIVIPNSVTTIGVQSFSFCSSLTNIVIPDSVNSIGIIAFSFCTSLTNITLSNNITELADNLFSNCTSLSSITIPNAVTSIGNSCFISTGITSISIPDSVTSLGMSCFLYCINLSDIKLSNNISVIPSRCFEGCNSLETITIPSNITTIDEEAFAGCANMTSITIPTTVLTIGVNCFEQSSKLNSINTSPYTLESANTLIDVLEINNPEVVDLVMPKEIIQPTLYSYGRPVIDFPNAQVIYYYGVKIWEREQPIEGDIVTYGSNNDIVTYGTNNDTVIY